MGGVENAHRLYYYCNYCLFSINKTITELEKCLNNTVIRFKDNFYEGEKQIVSF